MQIGPRTDEFENQQQHIWIRHINGNWYAFVHVKVSRTQPRIVVAREDASGWTDIHRFTT